MEPFEYGDVPGNEQLLRDRLALMGIANPIALVDYAIAHGWCQRGQLFRKHWSELAIDFTPPVAILPAIDRQV